MIYFRCSHCGENMEAPASLKGELLKCPKCGLHQTVKNPNRKKLWITLGIISVLFLSFCIYRYRSHSDLQNIEWAKKKLAANGLFLTNFTGKSGILRGRSLIEYKFAADATQLDWPDCPYLSIWTDDKGNIAGILALWNEKKEQIWPDFPPSSPDKNDPNNFKDWYENDFRDWLYNNRVKENFQKLTGFYMVDLKFQKEQYDEICNVQYEKWFISITRHRWNIDEVKYLYMATAQNW